MEAILNKLFIISFISILSIFCFINKIDSLIGGQFVSTVGKETSNTIINAEDIIVTDVHKGRKLNITPEQMKTFISVVTDDSSYVFDMNKRCLFVPQLSFEFKGAPEVTIFVSMLCNQVKIISGDTSTILDYDFVKDEFNKLNEKIINQK